MTVFQQASGPASKTGRRKVVWEWRNCLILARTNATHIAGESTAVSLAPNLHVALPILNDNLTITIWFQRFPLMGQAF